MNREDCEKVYQVNPDVRIRREHFGGIVFLAHTGTTIDLDQGAFRLLELIAKGFTLDKAWQSIREELEPDLKLQAIQDVADSYIRMGLISEVNDGQLPARIVDNLEDMGKKDILSAPEVIHWAMTYRCDNSCPDCYAARHRNENLPELSTDAAIQAIEKIADWGVFQIAVGGGEPLIRKDIVEIADCAHQKNLIMHITTSGRHLNESLLCRLAGKIKCLQIGIQPGKDQNYDWQKWQKLGEQTRSHGIIMGANLMLNNSVLDNLENIVAGIARAGFSYLTLLRYKPPACEKQWQRESPTPQRMAKIAKRVDRIKSRHENLHLRVDCALSFIQRHIPPEIACSQGIRGCVAGNRILAMGPDGNLYPCSQLVDTPFLIGNIMDNNYRNLWMDSQVLEKIRNFREQVPFQKTSCGQCDAVNQCGGCRIFSVDGIGADAGCPRAALVDGIHSREAQLQHLWNQGEYLENIEHS